MTTARRIWTETPEIEQWRLLGQYRYGPNVRRYLQEHGNAPSPDVEDYVSGSIGQAEAYYAAAKAAPLDISPLLLYYGTTSLLAGVAALIRGTPLNILTHGMRCDPPSTGERRTSDIEVQVLESRGAGLRQFCSVYDDTANIPPGSRWTLGELMGSLPDLKDDVRLCLAGSPPFVLRVDTVRRGRITLHRIPESEFANRDIDEVLGRVPSFANAYVTPQAVQDAVVLYRRVGRNDITIEALTGQQALLVGHEKRGRYYAPGQLLTMLMALYALGSVSRYSPALWHPFVRTDATGERLLIERLLSLVMRWLPNLVLNALTQESIRFTSGAVHSEEKLDVLSEADVKQLIKDALEASGR